jgi:ABC-2 type transport system permease protein
MSSSAAAVSFRTRPQVRRRGLPILVATLRQSRMLISAAALYLLLIGLAVGLIYPDLKALDLKSYLSNSAVGTLIGVSGLASPSFGAYLAVELYSSFFLLLFGGVMAYAAGVSIARDIEDDTIDLDLARPLSRIRLYAEKWMALLVAVLLLLAVSLLTGWLDTLLFQAARLDWHWFLLGHLELASLLVFAIGVGILCSSALSAARLAGGIATLMVVFGYLAQTLGTASDRLSSLRYLGPYYYAPAAEVIINQRWPGTAMFLVPLLVGLAAAVVGLVLFQRRDITA